MSKPDLVKIKTYKGVDILYNTQSGRLHFDFEGTREVKYVFEAEQIIDEPSWEPCDLKGFYLDNLYMEPYIGLAKANRRDVKSGRPDWRYKGRYDLEYKPSSSFREDTTKVFEINERTQALYKAWGTQRNIATAEQLKANDLAKSLLKEKAL